MTFPSCQPACSHRVTWPPWTFTLLFDIFPGCWAERRRSSSLETEGRASTERLGGLQEPDRLEVSLVQTWSWLRCCGRTLRCCRPQRSEAKPREHPGTFAPTHLGRRILKSWTCWGNSSSTGVRCVTPELSSVPGSSSWNSRERKRSARKVPTVKK